MVRIDEQDKVYRTVNEKYRAIIDDVKACYERRQPVLLGTTSIENSELLSSMLTKEAFRTTCSMPSSMTGKLRSFSKQAVPAS